MVIPKRRVANVITNLTAAERFGVFTLCVLYGSLRARSFQGQISSYIKYRAFLLLFVPKIRVRLGCFFFFSLPHSITSVVNFVQIWQLFILYTDKNKQKTNISTGFYCVITSVGAKINKETYSHTYREIERERQQYRTMKMTKNKTHRLQPKIKKIKLSF